MRSEQTSMSTSDLQHALARAVEWACEAGELARSRMGTERSIDYKADRSPVTDVDLELQELIVGRISREFPTHGIVAEEAECRVPARPGSGDEQCFWIIDPLDGTRNYIRGLPVFCVALALMQGGAPVVAVVHDPNRDLTYTAARGQGAFAGTQRLAASKRGLSDKPMLAIPSAKRMPLPDAVYRDWLAQGVLRQMGSTCLILAWTASGALDASYGLEDKLWDVAAGSLLVQEAGGVITTPRGESIFPIDPQAYRAENIAFLAAGQRLHGALLKTLEP